MRSQKRLPTGWSALPSKRLKSGGQSNVVAVRHDDGREGVYREMASPLNQVERERFSRELRILTGPAQHRAIVQLFDWNGEAERPWYISELGDPFDKWWRRLKRQMWGAPSGLVRSAVEVLAELSSALTVCHSHGVVHRDIKPGNLIVKRGVVTPWPILIDFGIAHHEAETRLTPFDQAVGNERFSPDVMRSRLKEVPPSLDVFDLGQLLIWMLDKQAPKAHWRRPVHWKYAEYHNDLPRDLEHSIRAFTAACANPSSPPASGAELGELLSRLFPAPVQIRPVPIELSAIQRAQARGEARRQVAEAEVAEEVQSAAPLAEQIHSDLRAELLSLLQEFEGTEFRTEIVYDRPFAYRINGATDLIRVAVGPVERNVSLRIKLKLVPMRTPNQSLANNHAFWRRHMAEDALCFTFALEGGVVEAHNTNYLSARWLTIRRDGAMRLHPLNAAFGNFGDNDIGGSAQGRGTMAALRDVRAFMASVLTNESYWEYIASR